LGNRRNRTTHRYAHTAAIFTTLIVIRKKTKSGSIG
jgi:hypothetical protein